MVEMTVGCGNYRGYAVGTHGRASLQHNLATPYSSIVTSNACLTGAEQAGNVRSHSLLDNNDLQSAIYPNSLFFRKFKLKTNPFFHFFVYVQCAIQLIGEEIN